MTKIEIDNKKMWETAIRLYRQITGQTVGFDKALEGMGLCYKDGEITTIEPEVKWYMAIDDYGIYNSIMSQVPIFHKGEMTTKEKVYTYFPNMTDEEFNKHFRPATEEEIPLKKTPVEVYRASVDSATKEPEQPKDEIPQKTKFKVGDHIKSDVLTPRKGVVTKVNNGWYILDGRYVLNFEYEDNWELVESKPEPKKCLFTKDHYTDEERKELCEGCQEECELNKDIEPKKRKVSSVLKNMLDNLDEESLAKTREEMLEETELTDFEKVLAECIHKAQGSVLSPEWVAITWSDALMAEAKKQIASELESMVDTMVSQNGGMCVHYREGIEDVINKIKGESV